MELVNYAGNSSLTGMLSPPSYALILWGGLGALTITLFLLMRTRWGQAQPLSKCVALSVLAHCLFAGYAYGTRLFCEIPMVAEEESLRLAFITNLADEYSDELPATQAQWGLPLAERAPIPEEIRLERREAADSLDKPERETPEPTDAVEHDGTSSVDDLVESLAEVPLPDEPEESDAVEESWPEPPLTDPLRSVVMAEAPPIDAPERLAVTPAEPPRPELATSRRRQVDDEELPEREQVERSPTEVLVTERTSGGADVQQLADALESLAAQEARSGEEMLAEASNRDAREAHREGSGPDVPDESTHADEHSSLVSATAPPAPTSRTALRRVGDGAEFPQVLRARVSPERALLLDRHGGNAQTEAAVQAALGWLAANQSSEGNWRARDFGAGQERMVLGHNRLGAGGEGDTGMTGLALLSFLGAGHTHYEGQFRTNVQHGLEYLLRTQHRDGSMAGSAELFAAMYCHGLAFLAVSEAYAMTGDERLRPYVERAQQFTLAAQISEDGGWRYQRGDRQGDTSQLGWQLMALRSAEMAGIPIPAESRAGMERFLALVGAGRHGGLASYRPGGRPSRTMTAEALACWIFLEQPPSTDARREAARFLREELPGDELPNLYYWYYGTLALFQLQDESWNEWNPALQHQLLNLQRKEGELAGSWDPTTVWGGYGGRVYSTAMAALCLEVYYRYLPLYGRTSLAERPRGAAGDSPTTE